MRILRIILKAFSVLFFAFVLGVIGLIWGATYGGNNGCFEFMGMIGYEACGTFFGIVGILLGILASLLAIRFYSKLR